MLLLWVPAYSRKQVKTIFFPFDVIFPRYSVPPRTWCWRSSAFQMLLSVVLAVLGFAGGAYCAVISSLGLIGGPLCDTGDGEYLYPFRNDTLEWVWLISFYIFAFILLPHVFIADLNFSKVNQWSTPSTPKFTFLWVTCSSWSSLWPRITCGKNCLSFFCCACQQTLVQVAPHIQKAAELWLPPESTGRVW